MDPIDPPDRDAKSIKTGTQQQAYKKTKHQQQAYNDQCTLTLVNQLGEIHCSASCLDVASNSAGDRIITTGTIYEENIMYP